MRLEVVVHLRREGVIERAARDLSLYCSALPYRIVICRERRGFSTLLRRFTSLHPRFYSMLKRV